MQTSNQPITIAGTLSMLTQEICKKFKPNIDWRDFEHGMVVGASHTGL